MADKILFVDDEAELCFMLSRFFKLYGYDVLTADTPDRALELANEPVLNVIVMDVNLADLAGKDGSKLMGAIKKKHPQTPIILYTGLEKSDIEVRDMLNLGAYELVSKSAPMEILLKVVQSAGRATPSLVRSAKSK